MTRTGVQPAWEKIVDIGFSNYSLLTRDQRVWFNIETLTTGGLWDHYVNSGADKNSDTIDDLEYLNFSHIANVLRDFNKKYFPKGVPIGPDEREIYLECADEDQLGDDIEKMDEDFWMLSEELENALLEHINKTGIGKE